MKNKKPVADTVELDLSTPEALTELRKQLAPRGSGPLSMMKISVTLIDEIARLRGWQIEKKGGV